MADSNKTNVVIIGGGYAGIALARRIDSLCNVVLIDPKSSFVHNVAAIRAIVEPELFDRFVLPYHSMLKTGRHIQDKADKIADGSVQLRSGETLNWDICIVATGSTYALPFKPAQSELTQYKEAVHTANRLVQSANEIVVAGAGPVGIELAGEVSSKYPNKSVILACKTPSLLDNYPARFGQLLIKQLKSIGVDVRLGVEVENLAEATSPFQGKATLTDNSVFENVAIFPTTGSKPNTSLLSSIPDVKTTPSQRVTVDPWLRPAKYPALFALGDVAETGDAMTVVGVERQTGWLFKTIKKYLNGATIEDLAPYKPWSSPPFLVPLGVKYGASVLDGNVVGPFLTSTIKGKGLFMTKYRNWLRL